MRPGSGIAASSPRLIASRTRSYARLQQRTRTYDLPAKSVGIGPDFDPYPSGYGQIMRGHVDSIARGINVANAQPNRQGLADVNLVFTWVRLAQRIPVRVHIDGVPDGVVLAAGMTATVQIDSQSRTPTE